MIDVPDDHWRWKTRLFDVVFKGFRCMIAVTYHPDDRFSELGYIGPKNGSDLAIFTEDACSIINELLQRYVSIETVTELIQRDSEGNPESIIGEIILQLAQAP